MATPCNRRHFENTRSVGAFTMAIMALVSGLVAGQIPPRSARLNQLLPLVGRHAIGHDDDAVAQLASWTRRDLEDVSNEMRRLAKAVKTASSTAWRSVALEPFGVTSAESFDAFLRRTAMLHTDVAIFHRTRSGYSLPIDPAMQHPLSSDGRSIGVTNGTFHWEAARRALDAVRPSAAGKDDVLLWYQTTTAILQWWNDYYELEPHLIRARERFPRDAVLLMYDGTVHENLAEPRIQNAEPQTSTGGGLNTSGPCLRLPCAVTGATQQKKSWVSPPAVEWRTAQALFEQALKIDPDLSEARVRLGRVLALQNQHETAVTQLKQVALSATLPSRLRYFSLLLLGREQWTLGRHQEAEMAYAQAAALYPGAQSPRLGLSQVAHEKGDRTQAVAHLSILGKPPASAERDDPWWTYSRIHVPDSVELMTMLHQRLSK